MHEFSDDTIFPTDFILNVSYESILTTIIYRIKLK